MLNEKDLLLLEKLQSENPDAAYLFHKLEEERHKLFSAFTHEIRNPLTLINSSLQLIEASHPEALTFRFWPQIKEDLQYLRLLLDDFSRFNNALTLKETSVELNDLAAGTAASFTPRFESMQLTLLLIPWKSPLVISGDPVKLKEVLINLLKNALEAAKPGGTASVRVYADASFAYLEVADDGCGIPFPQRETIFLPFETTKAQGTGLGLPIAKQIAIAHGGDLRLSETGECKTVFTLSLPL